MKTQVITRNTSRSLPGFLLSIFIFISMLMVTYSPNINAEDIPEIKKELLIKRLQQGGMVVYIRHAATDRSQEDQHPVDLEKCETQRNLSELGRKQSDEIGRAFKRLTIPISEVLTSPFCRCKETAELAFNKYVINENLYFAVALNKEKREAQTKVLQRMISEVPESGNRIIVSHTGNLREATGLWPKPEGVAYIFEPKGNREYKKLGFIVPDEWNNL